MSNGNLKESAFPITLQHGLTADSHVDVGFTKHEYATILLVAGYLGNSVLAMTKENGMQVIDKCHEMAAEILNRFP